MIGAVWKVIIFTSMVNILINTSRNERVTLQVWYMPTNVRCVHPSLHGTHRGDSPIPAIEEARCDGLHSRQRHPVVWNCWYQRLMLLGDEGSPLNCRRNARRTETTDTCFTNCSTQNAFCSGVATLPLCYFADREKRGEWDCACARNLNTCCFVPCGKLSSACILKAVMAKWNCPSHIDTLCICGNFWQIAQSVQVTEKPLSAVIRILT
jgi:hypothetical protein